MSPHRSLPRLARRGAAATLATLAALATACTRGVNTLPPLVRPDAAALALDLEIPAHLEIRSVDFSAALYGNVSGAGVPEGPTTTSVGGRAFVKVTAVDARTRETYLLLYEDIERRKQPTVVLRFRPAP